MNAEQQVVKDVAAGSFDIGFAGTSVFDTLGVTSFQALSAPMLIDNYPLENAVIRSSLPGKMMAGLAKLNVTGLAVFGDEMRRPIGVRQPILSPGRLAGHHVRDLPVKGPAGRHQRSGGKARPGIRDRQRPGPRRGDTAGFRPESGVVPASWSRNTTRLTSRPTSTYGPGQSRFSPTQVGSPSSPLPSAGSCTRRRQTPRSTRPASSRTKPSSSARYASRARGLLTPRPPTCKHSGSASRRSTRISRPIRRPRR